MKKLHKKLKNYVKVIFWHNLLTSAGEFTVCPRFLLYAITKTNAHMLQRFFMPQTNQNE